MEFALGQPLIPYASFTAPKSFEELLTYWSSPTSVLVKWFCLIAATVFSSIQSQDMYDQEGDDGRGRRTLPLVVGDVPARWTIAIAVAFWSCACLYFWDMYASAYTVLLSLLGITVIVRTLAVRIFKGDKRTFLIWNLWIISLYILPFVRYMAKDRFQS